MTKLPRKPNVYNRNNRRRRSGFSRELAVLYEDDAVVAVNKPPGLLAVPVEGSDAPSALSILIDEFKKKRERVLVVHRIDRFASGVLLFAKTQTDREALIREFLQHTPLREYVTVVRGQLTPKEATLVHYFRREGMFQKLSSERDSKAARAELRYSVTSTCREASLVKVTLETGLQNQIRVQLAAVGHPIVGDRKYAPAEASEKRIARVALHAVRLQFVHPRTGDEIAVDCKLPPDLQSLIQSLRLAPRKRR